MSLQTIQSNKELFPEHLPLSEIQRGIKTGRYLQGNFLASRENYLEANVSVENQEKMVSMSTLQIKSLN